MGVQSAHAAGNGQSGNKLRCFSDDPATCTEQNGSAALDSSSGGDAGVFISPGLPGKPVGDVNKLSFDYSCDDTTGATNCVTGGSPRISIPIDDNGDRNTDAYAFLDANNCGQAGAPSGTVDLTCPVFYAPTLYPHWSAFVAANPTFRIARDALAFVIVDQPFTGTVSNVQLGKAAAK